MTVPQAHVFEPFRLLPAQRLLLRDGAPLKLGGRAFDTLVALVERRDRVVGKGELMDLVWPRLVVEENNLQVQVATLRKLLGHPAIATIPGRGYRFTLPVVDEGPPASTAVPAAVAGTATAAPALAGLPAWLPEMIGRDADLGALRALVERRSLVTVAGSGGSGKTRLAQALAAALADPALPGPWWVDLAALTEPDLVPAAVAQAMGLRLDGDRDAVRVIAAALPPRPALLVLDNAEHLRDAVAGFVARMREAAPRLRLLVTSQEILHLADEHVFRLGPLSLPADDEVATVAASGAAALFVARARAVERRFALDAGSAAAVAEVCRRLDGIPLAIELAAARLPLLGLDGLRQRLDQRLRVLSSGDRSALQRQRTLRAALEWSHQLLAPAEQAVLRRLAVFAGGFTLEAAQQVAEDEQGIDRWDVLEHLGALVDKSLVVAEGDPLPRYRLLDTTRLFALERLIEAGEAAACRSRHRDALLALTEEAVQRMLVADPRGLATLDRERDNLLLALAWAEDDPDGTLGLRLAAASRYYWTSRGLLERGLKVMREALARPQGQGASLPRCLVLGVASNFYSLRGQFDEALVLAGESVAMARGLGDARHLCLMLSGVGFVHLRCNDVDAAVRAADEALALGRGLGDGHALGNAIGLRAAVHQRCGERAQARALSIEAIAMRRRLGHLWSQAVGLLNLSMLDIDDGEPAQALPLLQEALDLSPRIDSDYIVVQLVGTAAEWAAEVGLPDHAVLLDSASAAMQARMGMVDHPDERQSRRAESARARLDAATRERLQHEGPMLDPAQALERVRDVLAHGPRSPWDGLPAAPVDGSAGATGS